MQASKKHSFLRRSPLAYVVVPLAFVLVSTALVFIVGHTVLAPYQQGANLAINTIRTCRLNSFSAFNTLFLQLF